MPHRAESCFPLTIAGMLYDELTVVLCENRDGISEKDLEKLKPWREKYQEDLLSRWNITSKQYADFREDDSVLAGWVSYDKCEKFVDTWMKEILENKAEK